MQSAMLSRAASVYLVTWNMLAPYGVLHAFSRLSFPVLTNHLPANAQQTWKTVVTTLIIQLTTLWLITQLTTWLMISLVMVAALKLCASVEFTSSVVAVIWTVLRKWIQTVVSVYHVSESRASNQPNRQNDRNWSNEGKFPQWAWLLTQPLLCAV